MVRPYEDRRLVARQATSAWASGKSLAARILEGRQLEILDLVPRLQPGEMVRWHDILLPRAYSEFL